MATAAKPAIGGAISVAAVGSTLPVSADGVLDTAFAKLGYVSENGVVRAFEEDSDDVKEWGGSTVLVTASSKKETFKFGLMDVSNIKVLGLVFGDENVTGDISSGITVKSNSKARENHSFAIDMIEEDNTIHRIVIPNGSVTEVSDIAYVANDAVVFEITVTALADAAGQTAYDYIKK